MPISDITLSPETLSNDHIKEIGNKYLSKYGVKLGRLQLMVFSQHLQIANVLRKYNHNNPALNKWLYLANVYAQLGSHKNEIADEIKQLFHKAFTDKINTLLNNTRLSVRDLSGIFLAVANDHFYDEFIAQKSLYINRE